MRMKRCLLPAWQGAMALVALCVAQASMAQAPWALAKEAEGIKVYTRQVDHSQLQEFKGEMELAVGADAVVKVLKDANAFKLWMPDVVKSELLKSSDDEQYHYLENAAPWPVSNRDGIYHFTFAHGDENGANATIVSVEAAPDYLPRRDGKVRVPKTDGFWNISGAGAGVKVIYQLSADPGGSIPAWAANRAAVDTPFNTLKNLRNFIQSTTR